MNTGWSEITAGVSGMFSAAITLIQGIGILILWLTDTLLRSIGFTSPSWLLGFIDVLLILAVAWKTVGNVKTGFKYGTGILLAALIIAIAYNIFGGGAATTATTTTTTTLLGG